MNRKEFLQSLSALGLGLGLSPLKAFVAPSPDLQRSDFGEDFLWGVATAAYQIEGAWDADGKSPSVWDYFTEKKARKIKGRGNGREACDFYHRYEEDIALTKQMGFEVFRFSIAWTRILPEGTGRVEQRGLDFYRRVIDCCRKHGLQPWITLYHWDLPQCLEEQGGWSNRAILEQFAEYTRVLCKAFPDVKHWMILNEPTAFTTLGYLAGIHAPGKIAPKRFLASVHHASLCMGIAGRIIREQVEGAYIGSTFSCSPVEPKSKRHSKAAARLDALLNRLFIEPILGMGYPTEAWPFLRKIKRYIEPGDMELLLFDFDFVGLQNYTRVVAKRMALVPFLRANQVKPKKRGLTDRDITLMNWEVYPKGIYEVVKQFSQYENLPPIIITENGAAFEDEQTADGRIHDQERIGFFKSYLKELLRAKQEGMDIRGYLVWTLMDNFEWAEGYAPRFGLVHIDFETEQRTVKDSGLWFQEFLH